MAVRIAAVTHLDSAESKYFCHLNTAALESNLFTRYIVGSKHDLEPIVRTADDLERQFVKGDIATARVDLGPSGIEFADDLKSERRRIEIDHSTHVTRKNDDA